ncbi:hypothetical protein, partial [Thermoleptolyngbya sp.]
PGQPAGHGRTTGHKRRHDADLSGQAVCISRLQEGVARSGVAIAPSAYPNWTLIISGISWNF